MYDTKWHCRRCLRLNDNCLQLPQNAETFHSVARWGQPKKEGQNWQWKFLLLIVFCLVSGPGRIYWIGPEENNEIVPATKWLYPSGQPKELTGREAFGKFRACCFFKKHNMCLFGMPARKLFVACVLPANNQHVTSAFIAPLQIPKSGTERIWTISRDTQLFLTFLPRWMIGTTVNKFYEHGSRVSWRPRRK